MRLQALDDMRDITSKVFEFILTIKAKLHPKKFGYFCLFLKTDLRYFVIGLINTDMGTTHLLLNFLKYRVRTRELAMGIILHSSLNAVKCGYVMQT